MHRPITLQEETRKPDKVRVLMFSGYSEENEGNLMRTASRVVEECKKKGIECFVGFVPYARSYKNDDGTRTVVNKDGKEFIANRHDTVVLVRGAASGSSGTLDMISAFERDGFFVINSRESIEICSDKYRTAITLTEAGLPTPRTALVTEIDQIEEVHKQVGGKFPVVAKTIRGSKGIGVFIIDSPEGLKSTMQAFSSVDDSQEIILQEYIDMKSDMRIVVLDGEIQAVMDRSKVKGDFRSNFSLGGNVKGIKVSDEIKKIALDAAKAVGCYNCGVDIAISAKTRKPYILEVNSSPGSEGIEKASSKNLISEFVKHITNKKNWQYSPTMVGREELMEIIGIGMVRAKFDTGNTAFNSIHADSFTMKNKKVTWKHKGKTFTNDIVKIIELEEGGINPHTERRPLIQLDIKFLDKTYKDRYFTLDDREGKGTDVLVAVNFMKEFGFVVDPGRKYIKTSTDLSEEKVPAAILAIATTLANHPNFTRILRKFKHKGRKFATFLTGTPAFLHIVKRIIPQMSKMETDDIMNIIDVAKNIAEGGSQMLMMGEERTLTKKARIYRDAYAEKLKKGDSGKGFKDRYGKDAEDVIFATATDMAFKMMDKKPTEFLKKETPKIKKRIEKEEEYSKDDLEGTSGLVKKRKRMTPGQVNEIADKYFTEGDSNE